MKKKKTFGDFTFDELDKWEKDTCSIVLFYGDSSIAFQKCKSSEPMLAVAVDEDFDMAILLSKAQVANLKEYLNKNF